MISDEMFIKFLTDIKANASCPVCGSAGWGITAAQTVNTPAKNGDIIVSHLPFASVDEKDNSTHAFNFLNGIPVLSATCKTCGYIRL